MIYSKFKFSEVSFSLKYDKSILVDILKFSGWNILANLCNVIAINGLSLLYNLFFSPIVVAAQTIAGQVASGLSQLTYNVRSAVNPQIIKLYANKSYRQSIDLTLSSADFLLDISILTCVPCIILAPMILDIWLIEVPEYAVLFTRILLVNTIVDTFNASYYAPLLASNKIAKNSIIGFILTISQFGIIYLLFNIDYGPEWARYLFVLSSFVSGWIVKPYILYKDVNYPLDLLLKSLFMGCKKIIAVLFITILIYFILPNDTTMHMVTTAISSTLISAIVLYLTYPKSKREIVFNYLKNIRRKH